jgi:Glyoxalase/Bleomycin resistance protein/Dioxygenase superfamily
MSLLNFGQPDGGIVQMAYVVEDIHRAMNEWVDQLKVGPWFLLDHFTGVEASYRGKPSEADVAIAMSFAGHMMIELIQSNNNAPSVYRETIQKSGYGFHHWGMGSKDFDRDVAAFQKGGAELAFFARVPSGGRVAYMDTTAQLPGMVELIELGADFEPMFTGFYRASLGWDGQDPIRPFA